MSNTVESILEKREVELGQGLSPGRNLWISGGCHLALMAAVVLAPLVAANETEPIEFVAVQIVPLQALGVTDPPPAASRPAPKPESKPKADPKPADEPKAAEPDRPVPDPEPVVAQPTRTEASSAETPVSQAPVVPPADPARREGSPLGSSLGTSTFGAAVGGLDNPDFVYSYYVDQMLAMISANWQRPSLGGTVEAMIHFRIHRDGKITELGIVTSSGYNSFDLAGLRAVQLAAPFPKLPQSYRHGSLGVNLILR